MRVKTARDLGNLVRERRHTLRLTQRELAQRAGVSQPWLSTVESGHTRAELGKLLALFAELDMTFDLSADEADDGPQALDLTEFLAGPHGRP